LQAALFKPGRFDRRITIGLPDAEGRRALITYYLEQIAHEPLPLERMVADTAGHAPALIRHVLNDAPVYAYMEGRRAIAYADFAQAHALYSANAAPAVREPFAAPTDETRRYIAYYQAGRTYMCLKLDRVGQTGMVSSFSLPTTHPSSLPDDSVVHKHLRTRVDLLADVQVALAGRAAEEVLTGTQTTAAVADLGQATEQAALLIERLAMDTQLAAEPGSQNHERVEALLQEQYAHVCDLLTNNRQAVTLLSEALMLCGELAERDIPALLAQIEARYPFVTPPTAQASPWMVARYLPASIRWESVHTPRRFAEPEPALPDDAEPEPDSSQE
jgi:ATP-dependent Zn protease